MSRAPATPVGAQCRTLPVTKRCSFAESTPQPLLTIRTLLGCFNFGRAAKAATADGSTAIVPRACRAEKSC